MDVNHVAKLANLTLKPGEEEKFTQQFEETLRTIDLINQLDTSNTQPTSQVTGLVNKVRDDIVDTNRVLSQEIALSQAQKSYQGFFVVPAVFDND